MDISRLTLSTSPAPRQLGWTSNKGHFRVVVPVTYLKTRHATLCEIVKSKFPAEIGSHRAIPPEALYDLEQGQR